MKKHFLLFAGILAIGFTSCKKEGCTNVSAVNYSSEAKVDDGSCDFEGTVMTSIGYAEKDNLEAANISMIDVYIDNVFSGTINVDNYAVAQSSTCNAPQNAPKNVAWKGTNFKTLFINYKNQATGLSIFSTDVTAYAKSCTYVDFDF